MNRISGGVLELGSGKQNPRWFILYLLNLNLFLKKLGRGLRPPQTPATGGGVRPPQTPSTGEGCNPRGPPLLTLVVFESWRGPLVAEHQLVLLGTQTVGLELLLEDVQVVVLGGRVGTQWF